MDSPRVVPEEVAGDSISCEDTGGIDFLVSAVDGNVELEDTRPNPERWHCVTEVPYAGLPNNLFELVLWNIVQIVFTREKLREVSIPPDGEILHVTCGSSTAHRRPVGWPSAPVVDVPCQSVVLV